MLSASSSDLIRTTECRQLPQAGAVEVLTLVNGTALVIAADSLSLYRSPQQVGDPLGNGLVASVAAVPALVPQQGRFCAGMPGRLCRSVRWPGAADQPEFCAAVRQ